MTHQITLDGSNRPSHYMAVSIQQPNTDDYTKNLLIVYFCDVEVPEYYGMLIWSCDTIEQFQERLNKFNNGDLSLASEANQQILGRSQVLDTMHEIGISLFPDQHVTDIAMDLPFTDPAVVFNTVDEGLMVDITEQE